MNIPGARSNLFNRWFPKKKPQNSHSLQVSQIVQSLLNAAPLETKGEHFKPVTEAVIALLYAHHQGLALQQQAVEEIKQGRLNLAKHYFTEQMKQGIAAKNYPEAAKFARHWGALSSLNSVTEAFNAYRQAVKFDPSHPDGWIQLGHVLKHLGEFEKAQESYSKVFEWATLQQNQEYLAIACNHLGILYWTQDNLAKAEEMFLESLRISTQLDRKKGMAKQYSNLGILYRNREEWKLAEDMFFKALEIDQSLDRQDDIARQYGNLGNLYATMGNWQKAEKMFLKSLEIDKSLEGKQEARNDLQRTEQMYLKSLEISQLLRCKTCMATDYSSVEQNDFTPTVTLQSNLIPLKGLELETQLQGESGNSEQYRHIGLLHWLRGEFATTEQMFLKSLDIEKKSNRSEEIASCYNDLGIIYTHNGDWKQAESMFLKSLELNLSLERQHPTADNYANLGTIYRKQKNWEQAQEMYFKSYELYQRLGHDNAQLLHHWLENLLKQLTPTDPIQ